MSDLSPEWRKKLRALCELGGMPDALGDETWRSWTQGQAHEVERALDAFQTALPACLDRIEDIEAQLDKVQDWVSANLSSKNKHLVGLELWNGIRQQQEGFFRHSGKPIRNGVACPQCGIELMDSCPGLTLDSFPAKKAVHCSSDRCGFSGNRLA